MVNDFVYAAKIWVFIGQRIETMWACGDNFFYPIIVEDLNILIGHHLEYKFISCTSGRIAGAHFLFAKDRELNAYLVQYGSECPGNFLGPLVKTTGAAYPK